MKSFHQLLGLIIFIAATAAAATSADAESASIGCPTGQAVQSINVKTGKLVCVPSGGAAAQLVDRDNVVIGQYMGYGVVSRDLNGYRVDICCITTTGEPEFVVDPPNRFLYSSADCQGTPYFFVDVGEPRTQNRVFRIGLLLNSGDIVFAGDPVTSITLLSFFEFGAGCTAVTEPVENLPVQPVLSVPLSSLGAPPYKVK